MSRAFSKILVLVILIILAGGGIFAWQYFGASEEEIQDGTANWKTYNNSTYNIELKYPPNWQLKEEVAYAHKYEGEEGFFQISAISGEGLTIDEVCENEAYHKLKPYGSNPEIKRLKIQDQEACLILPSDDQPAAMKDQSSLIIDYPYPVQISGAEYNYFVLWVDKNHIREIANTLKFIKTNETANWKTYRNEEYGFEIKYPEDWKVAKNIFSLEPNLIFCPLSLTDPDPEVVCKLKTGATKPQYEGGTIYLFAYNNDPKPNNPKYHYLGFVSGKYYYLYSEGNESIVNQMLSTFKFTKGETAGPTISCEYKKGEYEFRVYDSEGRVTGLINGLVKQEISRSVYANGDVTIYFPQDYYEYELFSLKEGNYQLERSSIQEGEEIIFNAVNIPISAGQTHRYKINWKTLAELKGGAELFIDNDGDGSFEKTIPIDGTEFACEEFIAQTEK